MIHRFLLKGRISRMLRKAPPQQPELSFLSFALYDLLAEARHDLAVEESQKVSIAIVPMNTLACISWHESPSARATIFLHSLFNRPDTPIQVIGHVVRHELLHLQVPAREIDGRLSHHPPEFFAAEKVAVPWVRASWCWVYLAIGEFIRRSEEDEATYVKRTWKRSYRWPYPTWEFAVGDYASLADFGPIEKLGRCL